MAISESSYGVGNRVYGGGSNAPTRGTVDPIGYIDRSLNKPSQSRSGLAAAALTRLKGPQSTGNPPGRPQGPLPRTDPNYQPGLPMQQSAEFPQLRHHVTETGKLAWLFPDNEVM